MDPTPVGGRPAPARVRRLGEEPDTGRVVGAQGVAGGTGGDPRVAGGIREGGPMNTLIVLVHTPLAKALGWTLLHFLWEGALIAALVSVGLLLCRPASARTRYALACAGMLAMLMAFAVTLAILWPTASPAVAIPLDSGLRPAPPGAVAFPAPPVAPPDRLPWIVPFWMAGVFAFYVRTAGGWLAAQRLRSRGTMPAPEEWQERLRALAARVRLTRPGVPLGSPSEEDKSEL